MVLHGVFARWLLYDERQLNTGRLLRNGSTILLLDFAELTDSGKVKFVEQFNLFLIEFIKGARN